MKSKASPMPRNPVSRSMASIEPIGNQNHGTVDAKPASRLIEWLTWKKRTCLEAAGSTLSVNVEAGKFDAIVYVLLHEATHVIDFCLGITPALGSGNPSAHKSLARRDRPRAR
jgi:hypothetical protein